MTQPSQVTTNAPTASQSHLLTSDLAAQAQRYARAAQASSTQRAYRSDWLHFTNWCNMHSIQSLPADPQTVALYIVAHATTHRPATLSRRLTSISLAHRAKGLPTPASTDHPAVGETLKGIRRTHGTAQPGKTPLLTADIQQVLAHLGNSTRGCRDHALLLTGYCGGLRRSEIAALDYEDIRWEEEGVVLTLRRSKTDQEGKGREVALPRGAHPTTCPVAALRAWLSRSNIQTGPLFRSVDRHGHVAATKLHSDSIGAIVKQAVANAGYSPAGFAGHSLRAGFATQAARNGATVFDIMRQTGHRSIATVSRYVREAELFRDSPAARLGL